MRKFRDSWNMLIDDCDKKEHHLASGVFHIHSYLEFSITCQSFYSLLSSVLNPLSQPYGNNNNNNHNKNNTHSTSQGSGASWKGESGHRASSFRALSNSGVDLALQVYAVFAIMVISPIWKRWEYREGREYECVCVRERKNERAGKRERERKRMREREKEGWREWS